MDEDRLLFQLFFCLTCLLVYLRWDWLTRLFAVRIPRQARRTWCFVSRFGHRYAVLTRVRMRFEMVEFESGGVLLVREAADDDQDSHYTREVCQCVRCGKVKERDTH